jgi:hypothetical protein
MPSDSDYAKAGGIFLIGLTAVSTIAIAALYGVYVAWGVIGMLSFILFLAVCFLTVKLVYRS